MERVATLIERLQQQFAEHADAEHLIITAQLLLNELQAVKKNPQQQKKVEVMMPGFVSQPVMQHEIGGGTAVMKKIETEKAEERNNDEHLNRIFSKPVAEEILPQPLENIPPQKIIIEPAADTNNRSRRRNKRNDCQRRTEPK